MLIRMVKNRIAGPEKGRAPFFFAVLSVVCMIFGSFVCASAVGAQRPENSPPPVRLTIQPGQKDLPIAGDEGQNSNEALEYFGSPGNFRITYQPDEDDQTGTVVGMVLSVQGRVLITRTGAVQHIQAEKGQPLFNGDTVATGYGGRIRYRLNDESIMTMAPESRMVLNQSVFVPGESRVSLLDMDIGKARFAVKKILKLKRSEFRVKTPTAVVGVRGSQWDQIVTENSTLVATHANTTIEVSSLATPDAPPTIVKEFEKTEVVTDKPPSAVEKIEEDEIEQLDKEFEIEEGQPAEATATGNNAEGATGSEAGGTCQSCHKPIFEIVPLYYHSVFEEADCLKCHVNFYNRKFGYQNYSTSAMVEINGLMPEESYGVSIDYQDAGGDTDGHDLSVIPSSLSDVLTDDDQRAPVVSGVEVKRVTKGIFADVALGWKTDDWSDTRIEYGPTTDYGNYVLAKKGNYFKDHSVLIDGLRNNQEYHFRVISTDPFGNRGTSADYTFSTSESFYIDSLPPGIQTEENVLNAKVVILGGRADGTEEGDSNVEQNTKPVKTIRVGVIIETKYPVQASVECSKTWNPNRKHEPMEIKPFTESGLERCMACHPKSVSHPVNIRDFRIPDELPTAEGKVMICSTCHSPHGTSDKMGLRSETIHQLCITCHVDRQ